MRIVILPIGDLHIKSANDVVLERGQNVIAALRSLILPLDACYAVFPGDIAFSGLAEQYTAAASFVTELLRGIEQEYPGLRPHALFVPGNHDCDLKSASDVRDIDFLQPKLRTLTLGGDIVEHCLAVQANYFSFVAQFGQTQNSAGDRLCIRREFPTAGGKSVGMTLINTAWLTQNPERAGHLYFPINAIAELETAADVELCVFHHPYNWLEPDNMLHFRDKIERRSDVIITGHQHFGHRFRKENEDGTSAYYIEGLAMFDPCVEVNGFNIIEVDLDASTWAVHQFHWADKMFRLVDTTSRRPLLRNRALAELGFRNNQEFLGYLSDPGAGFTHPRKKDVRLHDIFVYPSLHQRDIQHSIEKSRPSVVNVSGKNTLDFFRDNEFVLLIGDDKAGKTALVKTLYGDFQRYCNLVTLLIDGRRITPQEVRDTPGFLRRIIAEQYGSTVVDAFLQLPRERRAVLIDEFDGSTISRVAREAFIEAIERIFGKVNVTVGYRFDIDFVTGKSGLPDSTCCHTWRVTGITTYRANGGTLENAQAIAGHESPRTTKLYDRTSDDITLDEVERIEI